MSFGFGFSDVVTLVQLAYATFAGAKRACGEHDELTREMSNLVTVLDLVQSEISDPDSAINMVRGHRRKAIENQIEGCLRHVQQMNAILTKFNALSDIECSGTLWQSWQKVRFANGAVKDIAQVRLKISTYTTAIHMSLTLLSFGSRGEAERQLSRQRGELRGITESINMLVAKLNASSSEGSIWSKYTDDDVDFWRSIRRQLVKKGYKSRIIRNHESLIQAYVRELETRVFDADMRNSQSSLDPESETGDSNRPEVGSDQVEFSDGAQTEDGASELEDVDISGLSIEKWSWVGEANIMNKSRHYQQPTMKDFEQLSGFDQVQGEKPLPSSNDGGNIEEKTWPRTENSDHEPFSSNTFEMAQSPESLEQLDREQRQQTMSCEGDAANERIRVYKILSMAEDGHHINMMPSSHVDEPQTGDSGPSLLSELQPVIIDNTSATNEIPSQDIDTPLDREAMAKARDEAFSQLSSDEKKVIITMQDPSGRKYSLPYFLVKTWDGMQYLIEQAFLNIEEIGSRVAKGEYDLVNSNGAVIIPHLWETFVEPDMLVEMQIWPSSSPQMQSALPMTRFSAPAPWTPPPSPPRPPPPCPSSPRPPSPRRSPPSLPPPRLSPSRLSIPRLFSPRFSISVVQRRRSTSQVSSYKANDHKSGRNSITSAHWPMLWSSRPPKKKSTGLRRIQKGGVVPGWLPPPPPPPPSSSYRSYVSSYECTCWECHYSRISSQERPSEPSSFTSQFKVKYPQVAPSIVQPEGLKKAAAECTESIINVEPIFEIEGEQIYELE